MASTFHGLEVAKRALNTQQTALYTVGHNISNANTPGYTRQRVNFESTSAYPSPGLDSPKMPGQLGTGVAAGSIQRMRDSFTDMQYRTENSNLGYWESKAEMLSKMEDIMNEPSDTGIASTMDQFWNSLQDLGVRPQDDASRRVVRERGIALANTFNYVSNSLTAIQKEYRNELESTQNDINSILSKINSLNKQIQSIEQNGLLPNDLYDSRDRLLDDLSSMVSIKVDAKPSGGLASSNAEGIYDVYLATPNGDILTAADDSTKKIQLINSETGTATGIQIKFENSEDTSPVTSLKFYDLNEDGSINTQASDPQYEITKFSDFNNNGTLKGTIEGYGYAENGKDKGIYNEMLADLDHMAYTFATEFNNVHSSGWSIKEIEQGEHVASGDFFSFHDASITSDKPKGAAAKLVLADDILADVENIAAAEATNSSNAFIGNGSNAQALADVKDQSFNFGGNLIDVQSFYKGVIGELGEEASSANQMTKTATVIKASVEERRLSVSSVSLDEEMTNMIQFQHAYNAAARNITMIDEMLDKIINGMGTGGR